MPLPKNMKAGISIQYHQVHPPGLYLPISREITAKATPIARLRIAWSIDGGLLRMRRIPKSAQSSAGASGNLPLKACGTRLILAPQARQKLAPSRFWLAHFGQYILGKTPSKSNAMNERRG